MPVLANPLGLLIKAETRGEFGHFSGVLQADFMGADRPLTYLDARKRSSQISLRADS